MAHQYRLGLVGFGTLHAVFILVDHSFVLPFSVLFFLRSCIFVRAPGTAAIARSAIPDGPVCVPLHNKTSSTAQYGTLRTTPGARSRAVSRRRSFPALTRHFTLVCRSFGLVNARPHMRLSRIFLLDNRWDSYITFVGRVLRCCVFRYSGAEWSKNTIILSLRNNLHINLP